MKVMVLVKATAETEAGVMPTPAQIPEMGDFNESLAKAGILLAAEGLRPSRDAARVRFQGSKRTVIEGSFTGTNELVGGFWLWQVRSLDETVEWLKRAPFDDGAEVEIRPSYEADDFGEAFTAHLRARAQGVAAGAAINAAKSH